MRSLRAWIRRRPTPTEIVIQILFAVVVTTAAAEQGLHAGTLPDFATIWAAQQTSSPYSNEALQRVLGSGRYVYAYPPTALLLTAPLRLFGYASSYVGWGALSTGAVVLSLQATWAPVVLAVPAVILSGLNGQTSLLMAALLMGGAQLRDRPLAAGALYGLAAALKPQVVLLVPVFLLGTGQWRTILAAGATSVGAATLSVIVYGTRIWVEWAGSLPTYLAAQDAALAHRYLSLPGAWRVFPLTLGAALAFVAGRRGNHLAGVFICVGAGLLASLHAMDYDEAILAPFALAAAAGSGWRGLALLAPLLFAPCQSATLALTLLAASFVAAKPPPSSLEPYQARA
jgi:hypothetical protein